MRSRLAAPDGKIMVPVVTVVHDDQSKNVYGTITHNRARGIHQLGPMKAIIKGLLDAGKTPGGPASTIVDVSGAEVRLVRAGPVTWESIDMCLRA